MKKPLTILGLRPTTFFLSLTFMSLTLMLLERNYFLIWFAFTTKFFIASVITHMIEENNNG